MIRTLLNPDRSLKCLHFYHRGAKLLVPGIGLGYLYDPLNILNAANFGFHSYVSCSGVITDYAHKIPIKDIHKLLRPLSFSLHALAILGFWNLKIRHFSK
tara:strand:- start:168 stop:467 length:300 start_codon:yes stop_codon:yes gene_type:complete